MIMAKAMATAMIEEKKLGMGSSQSQHHSAIETSLILMMDNNENQFSHEMTADALAVVLENMVR